MKDLLHLMLEWEDSTQKIDQNTIAKVELVDGRQAYCHFGETWSANSLGNFCSTTLKGRFCGHGGSSY